MAGLSETRASTQDNSSGTQVAVSVNEADGVGALQATVDHGNKTTYSELARTGLTTADTSTTDLSTSGFAGAAGANLGDAGNAKSLTLRATCDTASKTLAGRVILYDGSNNPIGMSEQITFVSDANRRLSASGNYVCQRYLVDCGSARKVAFYVDTLSGGSWSVYVRPV